MRAVIIDDEYPAICELTYLLEKHDTDVIGSFMSPETGYEFLLKEQPEVVFLDIDMPRCSGLELGVNIRSRLPSTSIVYVTAYPQYALESFRAYPVDYILKPVDEARLHETVQLIKSDKATRQPKRSALKINCFGKFRLLADKQEIRFSTQKVRELFAFLLCNDSKPLYKDELIREIFDTGDEKKDLNNLRVSMHRLRTALMEKAVDKEQLLIKNDYSLYIGDGLCDFTDFSRFMSTNAILYGQNIEKAERIAGMLQGEFFSDIDAPWVSELRERVLLQAEDLLMKIGLYYVDTEDIPEKAEWYFSRVVEMDPLSETGYAALLDLYITTGNTAKFDYTYRAYSKLLYEEFGCQPEKRFAVYHRQNQ